MMFIILDGRRKMTGQNRHQLLTLRGIEILKKKLPMPPVSLVLVSVGPD